MHFNDGIQTLILLANLNKNAVIPPILKIYQVCHIAPFPLMLMFMEVPFIYLYFTRNKLNVSYFAPHVALRCVLLHWKLTTEFSLQMDKLSSLQNRENYILNQGASNSLGFFNTWQPILSYLDKKTTAAIYL